MGTSCSSARGVPPQRKSSGGMRSSADLGATHFGGGEQNQGTDRNMGLATLNSVVSIDSDGPMVSTGQPPAGGLPKRLNSRASSSSFPRLRGSSQSRQSPKLSVLGKPKAIGLDTFDFEAAAKACNGSLQMIRALAVGLVSGMPKEMNEETLRRVQEILSIHDDSVLAQALRQETCIELIVPSSQAMVNQRELESCVSFLGPSLALESLIPRCDTDAMNYLLLRCVSWMDDEKLGYGARGNALELMNKVVSSWKEVSPPSSENQELVAARLEKNLFACEDVGEFIDVFASTVQRGWNTPLEIWRRILRENRDWDARAYRVMTVALSFSNIPAGILPLMDSPEFETFVTTGLKQNGPRGANGTLVSKLAFDIFQHVASQLKDECFDTFGSLFQLFDDPNVHLVVEPFKSVSILYEKRPNKALRKTWNFSSEWTSILFAKAFTCANPDVVRLTFGRLLTFPFDFASGKHHAFPDWFLAEYLLPCLELDELYSSSMLEATGAFRIQPTTFTTGKFKKNMEREEAKNELQGFNLPDSLYQFLSHHFDAAAVSTELPVQLFKQIRDLNSLSGAFTASESLTRALSKERWRVEALPDEYYPVLSQILSKHGAAGILVKRTIMLIGCILAFAVDRSPKGNFSKVLKLCQYVPDYFLRHDSPAFLNRGEANFLVTFGRYLLSLSPLEDNNASGDDERNVVRVLIVETRLNNPEECGLLCAALRAAGHDLHFLDRIYRVENLEDERRWGAFAFRCLQIGGPEVFCETSSFQQELCTVCLNRINSTLKEEPDSADLLEDAWIVKGGFGRATLVEKLDSLPYCALSILRTIGFKVDPAKMIQPISDSIHLFVEERRLALRPLVVLSVLLHSTNSLEVDIVDTVGSAVLERLVKQLCERKLRPATDAEWVLPSRKGVVSPSTLWVEFLERKWLVLSLLLKNLTAFHETSSIKTFIEAAAKQQIVSPDNSPGVMSSLVECLEFCDISELDAGWRETLLDIAVSSRSAQAQEAFIRAVMSEKCLKDGSLKSSKILKKILDPAKGSAYEAIIKRICSTLFNKTSYWSRHPGAAKGFEQDLLLILMRNDKIVDMVDYATSLSWRSVLIQREEMFICRAEKTIHPSALARFACLNWLDQSCQRINSLSEEDVVFLRDLAFLVLKELEARKFAMSKSSFHESHAKFLSVALLVLCRSFRKADCPQATKGLVAVSVNGSITADVKQNVEMVLTRVIVLDWAACLPIVQANLHPNANGWVVMSLLMCASLAWHRLITGENGILKEDEGARLDQEMLFMALPWITCAKSSIRVLATNIALNAKQRGKCSISPNLASLLSFVESNSQMKRLMSRVTEDQRVNSDVDLKLDLVSLLQTSEFNLLGDLCPRDLRIDRIADLVRAEQADFFASFGDNDNDGEDGANDKAAEASVDRSLTATTNPSRPLFFQKKIDTSKNAPVLPELGSARQSLVIVASAVDKIPNLAGLARTCEVFRARTLVVHDSSIVDDGEFKSISRTAEQWLPIVEVKLPSVPEYLMKLRRDEGFVLVGLEQTTSSIPLQDMEWPSHGRVCIVLGAEGTGVPPEILALLDATIEIPQFGYVKSLNVHVSGALCVWAYTQAMIAFGT